MKSWKTTSLGILTIVGALVPLYFKHAALTPEIIMAAATAVLAGIGLILARDNDKTSEDVGAGANAATSIPIKISLILLSLSLGLGVGLLAGCQAPSQRVAYNVVATPAMTADHAMQVWGDYVKAFQPGVDQERQVLDAFRKYKAAELEAIDAAHLAANSMGSTNLTATITTQLQSPAASQALSDLVSLIRQFGAKL